MDGAWLVACIHPRCGSMKPGCGRARRDYRHKRTGLPQHVRHFRHQLLLGCRCQHSLPPLALTGQLISAYKFIPISADIQHFPIPLTNMQRKTCSAATFDSRDSTFQMQTSYHRAPRLTERTGSAFVRTAAIPLAAPLEWDVCLCLELVQ